MSHGVPGIVLAHADRVTASALEGERQQNIYVEADGELLGRLPIALTMVPDALTVLVPQHHPFARK
jgi:diacylglycerol kinase family enzyme